MFKIVVIFLCLVFPILLFPSRSCAESLNPIFTANRGQLLRSGSEKLNQTIELLKEGKTGWVLENGQKILKEYLDLDPSHSQEVITLYRASNIHSPYSREFRKPQNLNVTFDISWMNYSDKSAIKHLNSTGFNVTFVNFSNARLGGYWTSGGNLQEEQIIQQCPDFPLILSKPDSHDHQPIYYTRRNAHLHGHEESDIFREIRFAGDDSADPILLTNLKCLQKTSNSSQADLTKILDAPSVAFISMAAPEINLEPGSRRYTPLLLNDLFNNAYTGFKLTKLYDSRENKKSHIITGRWGSGAFGHNISMSIAVQYLAARLAGIEQLEFAGITSEQGSNVIEFVNHLIQDAYAAGSDSKNISAKILLLKILNHEHTKEWEVNSSHVSIDSRESTEQNTVFKLKLPPKRVKSSIKNIE